MDVSEDDIEGDAAADVIKTILGFSLNNLDDVKKCCEQMGLDATVAERVISEWEDVTRDARRLTGNGGGALFLYGTFSLDYTTTKELD